MKKDNKKVLRELSEFLNIPMTEEQVKKERGKEDYI